MGNLLALGLSVGLAKVLAPSCVGKNSLVVGLYRCKWPVAVESNESGSSEVSRLEQNFCRPVAVSVYDNDNDK